MMEKCGSAEKVTAIILTGGNGTRLSQAKVPKQFIEIAKKPVFIHCLELFDSITEVDEICLVINEKFKELYDRCLRESKFQKIKDVVDGGTLRQDSVRNGLEAITHHGLVVFQNGVNPTTPADLIRKCINSAVENGAVTAYIRPFHTVFIRERDRLEAVLDRGGIGYTCDPQVYSVDVIRKALAYAETEATKDIPTVELVRRIGHPVALVESDSRNIKLTTEMDLNVIEHILAADNGDGPKSHVPYPITVSGLKKKSLVDLLLSPRG
jgi:2-C-methyl-D-erythritol 4-phosphate cytidylyltransferase